MKSFSDTFAEVLETGNISKGTLTKESSLSYQDINQLLSGKRRIGPKTLAGLLKRIEDSSLRRKLTLAYVDEMLREVLTHLDRGSSAHTLIAAMADSSPSSKKTKPSEVDASVPKMPQWLDELVEEAIEAGENNPEVAALISDVLRSVVRAKLITKSKSNR